MRFHDRSLQAAGYDVHIVSGDRSGPVQRIGDQVQVSALVSGAKPADKVAYIDALARDGHKVMMVGDGVNDAAALAGAHVSMSPVTAAELTHAGADAVFMGQSLLPVEASLRIARRAHRVMMENLWLAVIYNAIAVPIAIMGTQRRSSPRSPCPAPRCWSR